MNFFETNVFYRSVSVKESSQLLAAFFSKLHFLENILLLILCLNSSDPQSLTSRKTGEVSFI